MSVDEKIEIDVGATVIVTLPRAAGGASWRVASHPDCVSVTLRAAPPSSGATIGEPGSAALELEAVAAGSGVVEVQLARPWEPAARRTRRLLIVVRDG
ncbi:protease inhibitor I42 family protein [Myxococcota bacterium]|nr:protease inhibitor I42 family protein [Myxococcota bacterium]